MLHFHSPLIEPNGPISGIQLSDKKLTLSPNEGFGFGRSTGPVQAHRAGTD
jgi:hypothetical protein